jgi:hypothetical protein
VDQGQSVRGPSQLRRRKRDRPTYRLREELPEHLSAGRNVCPRIPGRAPVMPVMALGTIANTARLVKGLAQAHKVWPGTQHVG